MLAPADRQTGKYSSCNIFLSAEEAGNEGCHFWCLEYWMMDKLKKKTVSLLEFYLRKTLLSRSNTI
jgi:hypothetical protein